jgi:hypothetical protein
MKFIKLNIRNSFFFILKRSAIAPKNGIEIKPVMGATVNKSPTGTSVTPNCLAKTVMNGQNDAIPENSKELE